MKSAITIAALAGLTTVAAAQTVGTVTLTSSSTSVANIGDTFTIGVILSDNISGNSVFAFDLMIESFGPGIVVMDSVTPDPGVFGFASSTSDSTVTGLGGSSDILGPDLDPSLDGVLVFTFQVTATVTCGQYDFMVSDGPGPNSAMQWGEGGGIVINPREYDEIVFNGVSVTVFPAPGTASLLAGAALLATRRRR